MKCIHKTDRFEIWSDDHNATVTRWLGGYSQERWVVSVYTDFGRDDGVQTTTVVINEGVCENEAEIAIRMEAICDRLHNLLNM